MGREKEDFCIHKGLISHHSTFFHAAFNGPFQEGMSGVVELPEEKSKTFEIVHAWLYSKQLTQNIDGEDVACTSSNAVMVYFFGDKYGMPGLCNAAVDRVIQRYEKNGMRPQNFCKIYENTVAGSPLRRLLVAIYTLIPSNTGAMLDKCSVRSLACPEFLLDVSKALSSAVCNLTPPTASNNRRIADPCQYHQHAEGEANCT